MTNENRTAAEDRKQRFIDIYVATYFAVNNEATDIDEIGLAMLAVTAMAEQLWKIYYSYEDIREPHTS